MTIIGKKQRESFNIWNRLLILVLNILIILMSEFTRYSNSNWVSDLGDRKSTIGYAFRIGSRIMSWSNKKWPIVSLSSTEAKYKGVCSATCEAILLRHILEDAGEQQKIPTIIKCDNQSSIKLTNDPMYYHARSKHIETHHFAREKI